MKRATHTSALAAVLAVLGTLMSGPSLAQQPPPSSPPSATAATPAPAPEAAPPGRPIGGMKPLGRDRYQIGAIVVDKRARHFSVPGRIVHLGEPLEYLAVTRGGAKAYESLLELDATGSEFNLACILLGLDAARAVLPTHQFDERVVEGHSVAIGISWQDGRRRRHATALEALMRPEARKGVTERWIYLGSRSFGEPAQYAADLLGTLVGFVHDPASVIEHATGLGIGAYGAVAGDATVLPAVGTAVEMTITLTERSK